MSIERAFVGVFTPLLLVAWGFLHASRCLVVPQTGTGQITLPGACLPRAHVGLSNTGQR
jgi:hypothetical protein